MAITHSYIEIKAFDYVRDALKCFCKMLKKFHCISLKNVSHRFQSSAYGKVCFVFQKTLSETETSKSSTEKDLQQQITSLKDQLDRLTTDKLSTESRLTGDLDTLHQRLLGKTRILSVMLNSKSHTASFLIK